MVHYIEGVQYDETDLRTRIIGDAELESKVSSVAQIQTGGHSNLAIASNDSSDQQMQVVLRFPKPATARTCITTGIPTPATQDFWYFGDVGK